MLKDQIGRRGLRNSQLFVRVGKDRYIPVNELVPETDLFVWNEEKHRILPVDLFYPSEKDDFSSVCGANFSGTR